MKVSTYSLYAYYRRIRRRFPRLPEQVKIEFRRMDCLAEIHCCWDGARPRKAWIRIDQRLRYSGRLCSRELLHEVAHILAGQRSYHSRGHGHRFQRALDRLWRAGFYHEVL